MLLSLNINYVPNPNILHKHCLLSGSRKVLSYLHNLFARNNFKMHKAVIQPFNEGWVAPTHTELAEFKNYVGYSTNELAKIADIKSKHLRNFFKEQEYIKGRHIQYTTWRLWLESFSMVEPVKLEPLKPFLESRVFSHDEAEWKQPSISELRVLAKRSGYSPSAISRFLSIEEPLVRHLLNSDKPPKNARFYINHRNWMTFLNRIGIRSLTEYLAPPTLPDGCLRSIDDDFEPPSPKVIRQFIAWTGRSAEELAGIFGVDDTKLKFFTTNRSFRNTDASIDDNVFGKENWRAPNFRELRTFMNILSLDPFEIAHRLKLSKQEMRVALATRDNTEEKSHPLPIAQAEWFKLLDSLRIFNTDKIRKLTERESKSFTIHYSTWRLMLQSYGLVDPLNLERKTE